MSLKSLTKHFLSVRGVIDFLKLHFVLTKRNDSPFWKDNRDNLTIIDSLSSLLVLSKYHSPWHDSFDRIEVFPAASYQYVLCGMGFKTNLAKYAYSSNTNEMIADLYNQNQQMTKKLISHLPNNRILLNHY